MKFDKAKIEHLADLARIELTDEEKEKLVNDLNKILEYVDQIKELNLENEPLLSAGLWQNDFREDQAWLDDDIRQAILKNFPEKEGAYLKVPPVLKPKQ